MFWLLLGLDNSRRYREEATITEHRTILNTKQNYLSAKPCSVVRFITCLLPTHNKGINFVMPPMNTSLSEALSMCPYIHGLSFEEPKFLCVYVEMLS